MTGAPIKAVYFDFMGTCLNWLEGVIKAFPASIDVATKEQLGLEWRQRYFDSNSARIKANEPPEDIEITLDRTLCDLLEKHAEHRQHFDETKVKACVDQWHSMPAWPEVRTAIETLKTNGFEVFVFANGTTRLQIDLYKSSGLSFDMLFSSKLLGIYKPSLASYGKVLELTGLKPEESVMVAAHAYDLRGAKAAGMRTVYIRRWTDDVEEDQEQVKGEFERYLEDMTKLPEVIALL